MQNCLEWNGRALNCAQVKSTCIGHPSLILYHTCHTTAPLTTPLSSFTLYHTFPITIYFLPHSNNLPLSSLLIHHLPSFHLPLATLFPPYTPSTILPPPPCHSLPSLYTIYHPSTFPLPQKVNALNFKVAFLDYYELGGLKLSIFVKKIQNSELLDKTLFYENIPCNFRVYYRLK